MDQHFKEFVEEQQEISEKKGKEYSSEEHNTWAFEAIATLLKGATITPYTVGLIFKLKHTLALIHYAKFATTPSGETIRGRLVDDSNYNILLDILQEYHYTDKKHEEWRVEQFNKEVPDYEFLEDKWDEEMRALWNAKLEEEDRIFKDAVVEENLKKVEENVREAGRAMLEELRDKQRGTWTLLDNIEE